MPREGRTLPPYRRVVVAVVAIAAGFLVWELASVVHVVAAYDLPTPVEVADEWWRLLVDGVLWPDLRSTLVEALLGFAIALVVSSIFAYPLARSHLVASALSPYVASSQAMPVLALAPLLTVWFGLGLSSKTIICAVVVFFPMLVSMGVGLRSVDQAFIDASAVDGAGRIRRLVLIEIPLAAPNILAGIRMGLTLSFTGAIVAEFVSSSSGLGYLLMVARSEYDAPMLFASAMTIVAMAVCGYLLVGGLDRALIRW